MAARRDVPQHVHQRPWTSGGNPNRLDAEAMKGGAPTSWDLEVRRLRAKGIEEEELKIYVLEAEFTSPIEDINTMNDKIVAKLNGIATCRRQWFEIYMDCAGEGNLKNMKKRIRDLKLQVKQMQQDVRSAGGRPVPMPTLFNSMPKV